MQFLPNRRLLLDHLHRAVAESARTRRHGALLFLDLDHFKVLNDTHGHDTGDRLLQQVGRRLSIAVREGGIVARLGGDEFVVLLKDLGSDAHEAAIAVEAASDRIFRALEAAYEFGDGLRYHGTPSIGVALFDDAAQSIETLLKQADLAMYQAKSMGRNTLRFFDVTMQATVDERMALESDLRGALDRGELVLHYQSQIDHDGRVIGAEALVRWRHPSRGLLHPAAFIAMAEASGLIVPLGAWVLEAACTQLARWSEDPRMAGLTLSINVSAQQLREARFVESVVAALERTGADPRLLELELTESMLADDIDAVAGRMFALKARGVLFALDDFGTGYSSLSYLKRLPFDQLKIDQSFVREALNHEKDQAIVRVIVQLGATLGLKVVGEGVETAAQYAFLRDCGCRYYQGYWFGLPQPVDAFEAASLVATGGSATS